jgi:hypothetical protein
MTVWSLLAVTVRVKLVTTGCRGRLTVPSRVAIRTLLPVKAVAFRADATARRKARRLFGCDGRIVRPQREEHASTPQSCAYLSTRA